MPRGAVRAFCIVAVCLAAISCRKIEESKPAGPLAFDKTRFADAIPEEYGTLIAVTQNPSNSAWTDLFFQKPDKTITVVFVNVVEGQIYPRVLTIPRK